MITLASGGGIPGECGGVAGWFFSHINTYKRAGNEVEYVITSSVDIISIKLADFLKGITRFFIYKKVVYKKVVLFFVLENQDFKYKFKKVGR